MHPAALAPRRLGDLLVAKGYISPEGLQAALAQQKQGGKTTSWARSSSNGTSVPRTRLSSAWRPNTAFPMPSSTPG